MNRPVLALRLAVALPAALLVACGGGGGGDTGPSVTSASVSGVKYSQPALVTINGSNLDAGITVSSPGCASMTRSTTAPNISSATTAYYTCTVTAVGAQTVTIASTGGGFSPYSAAFTVPMPQVTMTVGNGAAVNGSMVITLAPDKTPITVDNFLAYVNSGFYNGTVFHRTVPNFMIQGGGYLPITGTPTPKAGLRPPIALEVSKGLSNVPWSVAMARTSDPNSATSQFFVNVVNNAFLDPSATSAGYAVFGSVTANTALVSAIVNAPCTPLTGFSECVPTPAMVISSATQTQ